MVLDHCKCFLQVFYRDAVGGFVVYDVTQRVSLEHCLQWKKEIDDIVQLLNGDPIPIVLIANKVCVCVYAWVGEWCGCLRAYMNTV